MPPYDLIKHKDNFTFHVPTSKIKLYISYQLRMNRNIKKYLYKPQMFKMWNTENYTVNENTQNH
jgi:hypothetical protein